jgi:hypothetical protein
VRIAKHACCLLTLLLACSRSPESDPRLERQPALSSVRRPPCSTSTPAAHRLCYTLDSRPQHLLRSSDPSPSPSLPPRELPCRRPLRTVTPQTRARSLPPSSSSPVPPEKHSTARVSRPAALSTLRTGQSPQHELVQRARRPLRVPAPPSLIPALSSRPTIACLFASSHLYTFLTH